MMMLMIVPIIVTRKHLINVVHEFRGLVFETLVDKQTIEAFVGVFVVLSTAFTCGGSGQHIGDLITGDLVAEIQM